MPTYDATDPDGNYQANGPRSVDIDALDERESESWNRAYPNAVTGFRNPGEMVDAVLDRAGNDNIHHLNVIDHGGSGYQETGDFDQSVSEKDMQDPAVRAAYLANIHRLYGHFAEDGEIDLGGCHVAQGPAGTKLLKDWVQQSGVKVTGGHDLQYPSEPGFEGPTTTCYPGETPEADPTCVVTDPETGMSYPAPE